MATWTKLPRHILGTGKNAGNPSKWEVQISYDHESHKGCYGYFEHDDEGEGGGLWFALDANNKWELTGYDGVSDLPRSIIHTLKTAGFAVPEDF